MSLLARLRGREAPAGKPSPADSTAPRGQAPVLEQVLAAKLLAGHLSNRKQLMAVRPSDLQDLSADQARLLIRAMGAAAHADGGIDALEQGRIRTALATASALDEADRAELEAELHEPPCLERLARQVDNPDTATRFYAVSITAIQRGADTNRAYLDYLASRLRLAADVVVRLNRRYNVPV